MSLNRHAKTMTGIMSIGLFSLIAAGAWPAQAWLTYVAGGLAVLRLIVLIRQLR